MTTLVPLLVAHANSLERRRLAAELDLDGYAVHEADTLAGTRQALVRVRPAAMMLGTLERPAASLELLRSLRASQLADADPNLAVFTFGGDQDAAVLRAYDAGSDHHVIGAPDDHTLTRAIVACLLRRLVFPATRRHVLRCGSLTVDVPGRGATVDGEAVEGITAREFELLRTLAADPERVFTKQELLRDVWGYRHYGTTRTLDSHACRLRGRLRRAGGEGLLVNVWGVGYRLAP